MKRTVIFSEKQIAEVCCNGNPTYLDNLYSSEDEAPNFANQISADGAGGDPTIGDDVSDDVYSPLQYGIARTAVLREMSKKEFEEMLMQEEKEHGNQFLKNRNFGAGNGEDGKSYGATKTAISRYNAAKRTMQTGATQDIKQQAMNTVNNMKKNWNNIETAEVQYNAAKNATTSGPKALKSAPKEAGNGKAHSVKFGNGYLSQ